MPDERAGLPMRADIALDKDSYIAGDRVRCTVTMTVSKENVSLADGSANAESSIAWVYAQVYSLLISDSQVELPTPPDPAASSSILAPLTHPAAGLGNYALVKDLESPSRLPRPFRATVLFATIPRVLFSDLQNRRSVLFEVRLPPELPPSYKGKSVKIIYKVVVCALPGGSDTPAVFQAPIRVFGALKDLLSKREFDLSTPIILPYNATIIRDLDIEASEIDVGVSEYDDEDDMYSVNSISQRLLAICQQSRKISFDICKHDERVARLVLVRSVFRLGETVFGILEFGPDDVPCFQVQYYLFPTSPFPFSQTSQQVSAFLEQVETIIPASSANPKHTELDTATMSPQARPKRFTTILAQSHCMTVNTRRMDIALTIPNRIGADFSAGFVTTSCAIRLEFIVLRSRTSGSGNSTLLVDSGGGDSATMGNFVSRRLKNEVDVEAFECVIPVGVVGG
ncbi:hypothetical protein HDU84_007932 [Entophlyctis sp. JEL0112]|nr:hypothetical protein HDU84_007932 [Entophlyctis sp. JEL0112]